MVFEPAFRAAVKVALAHVLHAPVPLRAKLESPRFRSLIPIPDGLKWCRWHSADACRAYRRGYIHRKLQVAAA